MSSNLTIIGWSVPFLVALVIFLLKSARATIRFGIKEISFSGAKLEVSGILPASPAYAEISASEICLENRSWKHLDNVEVIFGPVSDKTLAEVFQTRSIAKEAVTFEVKDSNVHIKIPDFPRGEKLVLNVLTRSASYRRDRLRGGGSRFKLQNADGFAVAIYSSIKIGLMMSGLTTIAFYVGELIWTHIR